MTKQEAFAKALAISRDVHLSESMATDDDGKAFEFFSVAIGDCRAICESSYERCFEVIQKMNPAQVRQEKIAQLRAELEALES